MKRRLLVLALGLAGLLPCAAWAETMYVQVAKARVLERPSPFSKTKHQLAYRTAVDVLGSQGAFYQVKTSQGRGYLAKASLVVRKPQFSSSLSRNYVSSDEVAIATKGFNAQVESDYKSKNPELPYAALDKMIAQTTYPDPSAHFMLFRKQGNLGEFGKGGGQE